MTSSPPDVLLRPNERLDDLMKCGRHIIQNTQEFCFSLDAVLLAHFPRLKKSQSVLDLGTGTGVIPLIIADEVAHVDAVELNPVMAELAVRNVALNQLEHRIDVLEGDYREIYDLYPQESFDLVLANPPYLPISQGKVNRLTGKARARHEFTATLEDVIRAARYALRYRGVFAMVHLPERLGEIFVTMNEYQMVPKRLRMVQPKHGKAPNMMLIEAIVSEAPCVLKVLPGQKFPRRLNKVVGAAPGSLKVLPPLIVHEEDGSYTKEILEIYGMQPTD